MTASSTGARPVPSINLPPLMTRALSAMFIPREVFPLCLTKVNALDARMKIRLGFRREVGRNSFARGARIADRIQFCAGAEFRPRRSGEKGRRALLVHDAFRARGEGIRRRVRKTVSAHSH